MNTKQKQYYKKKNKHTERNSLVKEEYTNIIIDLYTINKISLNKIKLELESKLDYDIPIRLIKTILIDNNIEIRKSKR